MVTARARARIRRAEQAQAVERERTRIARDMHDELGANLTQIGATSGLARTEPPEMAATRLREIGETARRSVEALDEIVWAVNPRYDSLAGTIEYLGKHAVRFLAATGVEREVDLPVEPPDLPLAADRRHHLLLVVKEALNNAVKHAHPKRVRFAAEVDRDELLADGHESRFHLLAAPDVGGGDGRGPAGGGDLRGQFLELHLAPGHEPDLAPVGGDLAGQFPPDAARRPGDERHLPGQ